MAKNEMNKYIVHSRFTDKTRSTTENGEKLHKKYRVEIDNTGHKNVVEDGYTNMYEKIQEATADCEIDNILAMVMQGDTAALQRAQAAYLDTTDMPKTLAEAQNQIIKLNDEFNALPIDVKRQFDFSAEVYVNKYGSDEWASALGFTKKTAEVKTEKVEKIEKEIKADE